MKKTGRPEKPADYYDKVYAKSEAYRKSWENSRYRKMYDIILSKIEPMKEARILDGGCGTGQLFKMLYDHKFQNVKGIDYSKTAVELALAMYPMLDIKPGNLFETDFSQFDVVILTEVMEHIDDDLPLLRKVCETVPFVIISVPSFDDPAHVRYFDNESDVANRYAPLFEKYEVEKIGPWFVMTGKSRNAFNQ